MKPARKIKPFKRLFFFDRAEIICDYMLPINFQPGQLKPG
jgi:hypothetical protein